jgi:hypothetical protein
MAKKQITTATLSPTPERRRWLITILFRGSALASPLMLDELMMMRFGDTIAADYTAWRNLTLLIAIGASAGLQMRALELTQVSHNPTRATMRALLRKWHLAGLPLLVVGLALAWSVSFLSTVETMISVAAGVALAGLLVGVELHRVAGNIVRYALLLPIGIFSALAMAPFLWTPSGFNGIDLAIGQTLGFWVIFCASYLLLPSDSTRLPAPDLSYREVTKLSIVAASPMLASGLLPALLRAAQMHSAAVAINLALRLGAMVSVPLVFLLTRFPEILRQRTLENPKTNPLLVAVPYRKPLIAISATLFAIVILVASIQPLGPNLSRIELIGATTIIGIAALVNVAVGPVKLSLTILGETGKLFRATLLSTSILLLTLPLAYTGIYGAAMTAALFIISTNLLLYGQLRRAV